MISATAAHTAVMTSTPTTEGKLRQIDVERCRAHTDAERLAADEGGRAERADAGERRLSERELPGPSGEDDEGEREQRQQQHLAPEELL